MMTAIAAAARKLTMSRKLMILIYKVPLLPMWMICRKKEGDPELPPAAGRVWPVPAAAAFSAAPVEERSADSARRAVSLNTISAFPTILSP